MFMLVYKAKNYKGKIATKYYGEKYGKQKLVSKKDNALVWAEKYRQTWQDYADKSNETNKIVKTYLVDVPVSDVAEMMYSDYVVMKKISW